MTGTAETPRGSGALWEGARGLASAVALTAGFTAIYVVVAPIVLLGALAGGPIWAAIVLAREEALGRDPRKTEEARWTGLFSSLS